MDLKDAEMKTRNWEYTRRFRIECLNTKSRRVVCDYTYMKLEIRRFVHQKKMSYGLEG
jgi:hypothetical protein